MSTSSRQPLNGNDNGSTNGSAVSVAPSTGQTVNLSALDKELREAPYVAKFHGDKLIGDKNRDDSFLAGAKNVAHDVWKIANLGNVLTIGKVAGKYITGNGLDMKAGATLVADLPNDSESRAKLIESQVKVKYDRMLHPPLTYLGDAFQYRRSDGKFNSAIHPHLGQAGAPYARTVPSKTHPLGALPDPGDLFDRLMAREGKGRRSKSGLSSMLIYHATIIIHDIFRTNDNDKNISDTSSYLDLSPLYGFTEDMTRKVRDDKYKLGLLKPDVFAENRLLRQPPGVCIMLVMYNRYHNYAATQLRRINENGRFSVPKKFARPQLAAAVEELLVNGPLRREQEPFQRLEYKSEDEFKELLDNYGRAWKDYISGDRPVKVDQKTDGTKGEDQAEKKSALPEKRRAKYEKYKAILERILHSATEKESAKGKEAVKDNTEATDADKRKFTPLTQESIKRFNEQWDAAWTKLDDDLFNTARLITCGQYIQVSIHDYLRALMGFHQYNTDFTLDPRVETKDKAFTSGLGNQVTVEFNLLYRFHCAVSRKDEEYTEEYLKQIFGMAKGSANKPPGWDPKTVTVEDYGKLSATRPPEVAAEDQEFGLLMGDQHFARDPVTRLFNDEAMVKQLVSAMDEPIGNFGPLNTPKCLKPIEIMGIVQARKWEIGTLNDFRDFFGMERHKTFESITGNKKVQDALRDLYDHPDKVELYPGVFCESSADMNADPGPSDVDLALWAAIFSDAITLVRSDRFYTVDWNTNSLTTWGMNEVTPNSEILKSSVFHRLLQRAFPDYFPTKSVRFFHPFYTAETNAKFAKQQGYETDFAFKSERWPKKGKDEYVYDVSASTPYKPATPIILTDKASIEAVLAENKIVHPVRLQLEDLPKELQQILDPKKTKGKTDDSEPKQKDFDQQEMMKYFMGLMRDIVKRNSITMEKGEGGRDSIYQIDVVRDFAIPSVTRYVADFLGIGNDLQSDKNPDAKYSENEIYQHITNCQMFFAYNADETKFMKRRKAFKTSMTKLFELTKTGHIKEAKSWFGWSKASNPMQRLGLKVAKDILEKEPDAGRASAIMLLIGLDSAYNSVLAFTAVLEKFMQQMTYAADNLGKKDHITCNWLEVQEIALQETPEAVERMRKVCLRTQRACVLSPFVRRVYEDCQIPGHVFKKGRTIICDVYAAEGNHLADDPAKLMPDVGAGDNHPLAYQSSFTEQFAHHHPKQIAALSLTAMITVVAQMKNLRRGHDAQGWVKKIKLDSTYERYSNYMAPMRVKQIELEKLDEQTKGMDPNGPEFENAIRELNKKKKLEKPTVHTYLTPEWDEMIPFPTTWKVRFNGYDKSNYGDKLELLRTPPSYDDRPPWYQPRGPSHTGGSFGTCDDETLKGKETSKDKKGKSAPPKPAGAGCALPEHAG